MQSKVFSQTLKLPPIWSFRCSFIYACAKRILFHIHRKITDTYVCTYATKVLASSYILKHTLTLATLALVGGVNQQLSKMLHKLVQVVQLADSSSERSPKMVGTQCSTCSVNSCECESIYMRGLLSTHMCNICTINLN